MIPRPKILSVITVPSGGWTFQFKVSAAGSLDTTCTATITAGDYFMAWDNQADDFVYAVNDAINDAVAASAGRLNGIRPVIVWLDSNAKINIGWDKTELTGATNRDVRMMWLNGTGNSATVAKVLGFDATADDTSTGVDNPIFTADYQHAYGWYADEDGLLEDMPAVDLATVTALQSVGMTGIARAQKLASFYASSISLQYVKDEVMLSAGVGYIETPVYPFDWNKPLECWWLEAQEGHRFRVYRDGNMATDSHVLAGTATGGSTTTLADSARTLDTDPQRYLGRLLRVTQWSTTVTTMPARFYISSHTATTYTVPQAHALSQALNTYTGYRVYDQPYQTYVVDLRKMRSFAAKEHRTLDRYSISIPLLRYV